MGMFDTIMVYQACPYCGVQQDIEAQTKDLECLMHSYRPLHDDWETAGLEKKFRTGMPVFPRFPLDKAAGVWKDQAERIEAQATVPEQYAGKLNYVSVIAGCQKCSTTFEGRVAIREGKLRGVIYDCLRPEEG